MLSMHHPKPRSLRPLVLCALLAVSAPGLALAQNPERTQPGTRLLISVTEQLDADPPESQRIDSLDVVIPLGREATLHAANFTLYITATEAGSEAVSLRYGLYRFGPNPTPLFEDVHVEYGVPLLIDHVSGKGKSTYRVSIVPSRVEFVPSRSLSPNDTTGWRVAPATYHEFFATQFSLAVFHADRLRPILENEYNTLRDTFNLTAHGKVSYYFIDGVCDEFPFDDATGLSVDPSRNRVVSRYDADVSTVNVQGSMLVGLYRWWGYAPALLALGASAYADLSDHEILGDWAAGRRIALDSIATTIGFKRRDPTAALHHAASFVRWLIATHGRGQFRDLYDRATDLSVHRAVWSVYGKTLGELETDWAQYLNARTFSSEELYNEAIRDRYYHRLERSLRLLEEAVTVAPLPEPTVRRDLGYAYGHIGAWEKSSSAFYWLYKRFPQELSYYTLLGEAYWAQGDWVNAALAFNALVEQDSINGLAFLRLGDIQYDRRRVDSAVTLWQRGLVSRTAPRTHADLLLRIGRSLRDDPKTYLARPYFVEALTIVNQQLETNFGDPGIWAQAAEALMELDSLDVAFQHLEAAAYIADAVVDRAHIARLIGQCHDRRGERALAIEAYDQVFAMPSPYAEQVAARDLINKPDNGRRLN